MTTGGRTRNRRVRKEELRRLVKKERAKISLTDKEKDLLYTERRGGEDDDDDDDEETEPIGTEKFRKLKFQKKKNF